IIITGTLGTNGNWQLSLFDLQGRKVLERTVALTSDGAVLSLTTIIANGTYSLKLTDLTNGTTINTSVILDR
ncbi:MAG TPA: hypothetical protein PK735_14435, partial [Flavobacteriales bacterium]|nr:hypothetical protein [Flavobacteriales bacterium]